jgi:hypothetical protein
MRRLLVFLVFALLSGVGFASRIEAQAPECLKGCDPKKIPCEFWYELKRARAAVRASYIADSLETYGQAYADEIEKYSRCKSNLFYRPSREFVIIDARNTCSLGVSRSRQGNGPFEPRRLEQELASSGSCSEAVQAQYERGQLFQTYCIGGSPLRSLKTLQAANRARLDSLEGSLFSACSAAIGAAEPREEAKKEIVTLKMGQARERTAKSAKRSAAKR